MAMDDSLGINWDLYSGVPESAAGPAMPTATASGGYLSTGLEFFNNVTDKWLKYQDIKTRNDLEFTGYDANGVPKAGAKMPDWVWLVGAVGIGAVIYFALRK